MRKFFTLIAVTLAAFTAQAQKTVQGSGLFDNWSIGVTGGGIVPTVHSDYIDDVRATYGVELTKQITTVLGVGVQFTAANNVTHSCNMIDAHNLSLLAKLNLSNWFCGYKGVPRLFEVEAVAGVGWGHDYYPVATGGDVNYMTSKFGANLNFNLGAKKAWTVALKPAIVYNMDNEGHEMNPSYHVGKSAIELTAGVTYHFKNRNNGKHHMTLHRAYDQAEVDGLNAKINDLRTLSNEMEATIVKKNTEIRNLQNLLNDCRNQKPQTVTETITKTVTVTKSTSSMEQTVTFRQGKHVVEASQLPNVERIATYLRNHRHASVVIKGYASPEGSAEINARIAQQRADAVKTILVNKYKIEASRIVAEGQGVGDMFSEPDWNRVSICTIEEQGK